ncbi:DUF697 domain-containing protein [Sorangium sp. So ce1036]|uniref:YcjF family protein n=1 Tax=Sorangium sp. So ce1036 TaxID=3133328 RepID=UPI003EFD8592
MVEDVAAKVARTRPSDSPETAPSSPLSRIDEADEIIHRNVILALTAGVVPIPIIDLVAAEAIQIKMLNELGELYGIDLTEDLGKKIAGSLLSTLWSVGAGTALGYSLARFIPFIGMGVSTIAMSLLMGASTRALGRTFVMHFESGGSLLDFDPQKMRSYFFAELDRSRQAVAETRREVRAP